ncbi:MAG: acyl-CoA thioesterase, partial [Pseudomonadota bacterium]
LNNGRTLTLYDLGRIPFAIRSGLVKVMRKNKWGLTMAGASVRYRQRIKMFETVEMRSRTVFWDERFMYVEQSMWKKNGECANHIVYRAAVTGRDGIVEPANVAEAMGIEPQPPIAPDWVTAWIAADQVRPWPPMQEDLATPSRS